MKKTLLFALLTVGLYNADAQITIKYADMPAVGDTLRYSTAVPLGFGVDLNDTGANRTWNFDTMTPVAQGLDEYKTALQVNPLYALTIKSLTAFGYQVADTLTPAGAPIPISVTEVYTFFDWRGSAIVDTYSAVAFAAKISGAPIPALYTNVDELFVLPLAYGNKDTSDYYLNVNIPSLGRMVQDGDRRTKVDAWGTIKTPFFTTAKDCIRVRSQVNGTDSIIASGLPIPPIGVPRQTVDYYWLVEGEHYPALWVTTTMVGSTETVSSVRYRDSYRMLSVDNVSSAKQINLLEVYPNPAQDVIEVNISARHYILEVYDMQGRSVANQQNNSTLDVSALPSGNYFIKATLENGIGYASFVKQ